MMARNQDDQLVVVVVVVVVVVMTSQSGTACMGEQRCPEKMRNSTRLWIGKDPSLPHGSWQPFINWGTTRGRLSLPTADVLSTIVKRSMLTDVDKLWSCSWFSDSVVGFTGQKTQPTASKYNIEVLMFWCTTNLMKFIQRYQMSWTVRLALVFHVFIAVTVVVMVCGRHGIGLNRL